MLAIVRVNCETNFFFFGLSVCYQCDRDWLFTLIMVVIRWITIVVVVMLIMNIPVAFSFAIAFALANATIHDTVPLTATAAITATAATATSIKVHPLWISHTHFAEFLFNTFNWIYSGFYPVYRAQYRKCKEPFLQSQSGVSNWVSLCIFCF